MLKWVGICLSCPLDDLSRNRSTIMSCINSFIPINVSGLLNQHVSSIRPEEVRWPRAPPFDFCGASATGGPCGALWFGPGDRTGHCGMLHRLLGLGKGENGLCGVQKGIAYLEGNSIIHTHPWDWYIYLHLLPK